MKDALSVISHATAKIVPELADEMEVSVSRMYEILGKDNPVPKSKRLIRAIGKLNKSGVRAVKADFNAMFDDILDDDETESEVTAQQLHKEAFEAVDALLSGKPPAEQAQELRELIAVAQQKLEGVLKFTGPKAA
jgi:hypothetical protein